MEKINKNTQGALRDYVERINNLLDQVVTAQDKYIRPLREDIKDIYKAAQREGFDKGAIKEVVRRKRMGDEQREIVQLYDEKYFESILK